MSHPSSVSRRALLARGAAAAGLALAGPLNSLARSASPAPFTISLAEWSLHRTIRSGELNHLDLARVARVEFGIDAVEYVNQFFKDAPGSPAYLAEMNRRAADAGVYQHLIMCDDEGRLGDPDRRARLAAVENHRKWVDAAKTLGCATIRVNAASEGAYDEQQKLAADGLRRLCELADPAGINVIVENHGGLSSNGQWLAGVMRLVNHPRCGTLPDFGNFTDYDRYTGVADLMPFAKAVSAKSHAFDAAGNETAIDYARMMKIVAEAGYHSWVGIEYEGDGLPERDGIRATQRLLERVRAGL
jgi:sugar phosphate isomerase/epimerase